MKDVSLYEQVAPLEKNFPVKFGIREGKCYLHWHEHMELLYFLTEGEVFCGEVTYTLNAGDLLVVNSGELHATYRGSFYCMRLNPSFFADVHFDGVLITPHVVRDERVEEYIRAIAEAKEGDVEGADLQIKGYAYLLVRHLLCSYRTDSLTAERALAEKNKASRVGEIVTYIGYNAHEPITTASLAAAFHMDEHYLCRLFKSQMGVPPGKYINAYRVEKAEALLRNTDLCITDVALAVGFDDASYFARIFKKQTGLTPREYKKKKE